jgi:23S rRNA pseudouridine2605 synthase
LILTNDGEFANTVIHPSSNIEKTYEVKVFGSVSQAHLKAMRDGVETTEGFLKPKAVRVIKQLPTKTWLEFRIAEGRNREIRRMCEGAGLTVDKLKRVAIGGLPITGIAPASYIVSTKKELLKLIGINEIGLPVSGAREYISDKKSISISKKGAQNGTSADDHTFHKFRKGTYYDSLKAIKETKKVARTTAYEEEFKAKEDAHHARKLKKSLRVAKKEAAKKHGHVQIM